MVVQINKLDPGNVLQGKIFSLFAKMQKGIYQKKS